MSRVAPALLFGFAYFGACALPIVTSRIGGGLALAWVATALLATKLRVLSPPQIRAHLFAACAGTFFATGIFGLGWLAAGPMALVNVSEGWIAAAILHRLERSRKADAPDLIGSDFVLSGLVAPLCTVLPGALIATLSTDVAFLESAKNWLIGHVLGYLVLGPAIAMYLRGNMRAWISDLLGGRRRAVAISLPLFVGACLACFAQTSFPLLFLPSLALTILTYYGGREGAAIGIVLLGLIGGALSLSGLGPITLMHENTARQLQFFEAYLAINCVALLPISAALSARSRLLRQLRSSEARYRLLSNNVTDIVLSMTPEGVIRFVSPSIRSFGPYDAETMVGRNAIELVAPEFRDIVRDAQRRTLRADGDPVQIEYVGITYAGERRWFETNQRCIFDAKGRAVEVVGTVREISSRKELEWELSVAAQTDQLTGLPNRRAMLEEFQFNVANKMRGTIALLDLDHFKQLNDRFGHQAGDAALCHFARIAKSCLRESDMLARWGGEEFAVLLPEADTTQAARVVQRLIDTLAASVLHYEGQRVQMTASAGVASLTADINAALSQADLALYLSKNEGRARLSVAA